MTPLARMTRELSDRRARLEDEAVIARVAGFRFSAPAQDVVRFALQQDVALILVDGSVSLASPASMVSELLASADCDVVVSVSEHRDRHRQRAAGALRRRENTTGRRWSWLHISLAGWTIRSFWRVRTLERARCKPSACGGLGHHSAYGGRDSRAGHDLPGRSRRGARRSRCSHDRSRASTRYRSEGLGPIRETIVREAGVPALVVRQGRRPGLFASPDRLTQFRWSISA